MFFFGPEKSPKEYLEVATPENLNWKRYIRPSKNGKSFGRNVLLVLIFIFGEPRRGSRGLSLSFSDCLIYFFHFRFSGVATYKPSLGPFFWSKEKQTLNAHISKSLLAPK